ncbi:hypothetical protein GGTG_04041 [Gaeumannomyces tritici R3-111a-1]|uniref:Uncharacterized protein n=1 Tax=Gaeumannomyces tritici (strain R3-111a-1) TaxID=644352 RepID=J3NRZ3_GAET3|nr:hypothetical protein GGTG_04041 [Gaeumannomyces tritici R3-111a-1]EJT78949.1 hypothetical protein GGTG_04041 [Gaeumannomyces tritici R3-111a-1]
MILGEAGRKQRHLQFGQEIWVRKYQTAQRRLQMRKERPSHPKNGETSVFLLKKVLRQRGVFVPSGLEGW